MLFRSRVSSAVSDIKSQNPGLDRNAFEEQLWDYLDAEYGTGMARMALNNSDMYWDEYNGQGVAEGTYNKDVERAFPDGKASGVKTGASAPKGTSTMPKDKEKAKGQPAGALSEMDKSQPSSDRGGESSGNPYAKGGKATPVKSKDVVKQEIGRAHV